MKQKQIELGAVEEINEHFKNEELICDVCGTEFTGKKSLDGFNLDGTIIWMDDWCNKCIKSAEEQNIQKLNSMEWFWKAGQIIECGECQGM